MELQNLIVELYDYGVFVPFSLHTTKESKNTTLLRKKISQHDLPLGTFIHELKVLPVTTPGQNMSSLLTTTEGVIDAFFSSDILSTDANRW